MFGVEYAGPPEGGGFLVLNSAQISNWDLVCLIKLTYPRTKIIAQQRIPSSARPAQKTSRM